MLLFQDRVLAKTSGSAETDCGILGGITTSVNDLRYFTTTVGTASEAKTFEVSATNLTGDVTLTASNKYEISTDGVTYAPTLTLTQVSGEIQGQPVTVYVRILDAATEGFANGSITIESLGVSSAAVTLDGYVGNGDCTVSAGPDVNYQLGGSAQFNASGSTYYTWYPSTGLDNPNIANPTVSGGTDGSVTSYLVVGMCEGGTNLIVNGDFESGNTGFTSDYTYVAEAPTALYDEGKYGVGTNPRNYHDAFSACSDNTSGSGNMMIINGAPVTDQNVWSQNITVEPNKSYAFSVYVTAVHATNPPTLQFSINPKFTT